VKKHAVGWIKGLFKYGIGFGLLAYVISKYWNNDPATGAPGLKELLQGPIEYIWLLAATLLLIMALSLQLTRWFLLVRALDLPFTGRNAFRLGMVGLFYNTFLPGSIGGDLLKAYFIAKGQPGQRTKAVATVLIDRAMGLFGLILFCAVLGSIAWAGGDPSITKNIDLQWIIELTAAIAVSSVIGFLLLGLLPQRRVDRFAGRLRSIPKLGGSLGEFWYAVWIYRQRLRVVAFGVGLSALAHFSLVFAFHAASRVFPPTNPADQATLAEHMVIAPIGFIIQALPLSPGGVGVGEAAFAGLYKLSGLPASRGVIARLSLRVAEWIIGLAGYIIYLRMRAELPVVDEEIGEGGQDPGDKNQKPEVPREPDGGQKAVSEV
jgi:glycosyltransferase 2 family protein